MDVKEELEKYKKMDLLKLLLKDRTTGRNIIWGTDMSQRFGKGYGKEDRITEEKLEPVATRINEEFRLQSRAEKEQSEQAARSMSRGEVFTPVEVVRMMNDAADTLLSTSTGRDGDDTAGPDWWEYVCSSCLEIACGEAPYLVTRYDASTGKDIPLEERTGLLDRKLRLVNENMSKSRAEWMWAARWAYRSTYGYEFQGDNLLLARLNLLSTAGDYMRAVFGEDLTGKEYKSLARIIVWNIWQMDGLTGHVPYKIPPEQIAIRTWGGSLSDRLPGTAGRFACRVSLWEQHGRMQKVLFDHCEEGCPVEEFKCRFVVGNPPYQELTAESASETNGQIPRRNIFQYFQMQADHVAETGSVLIYPAGRWIHRSGKGLEDFGLKQINDPALEKIVYFPDSKALFPSVAIADGIGIVIKRKGKTDQGFDYVYNAGGGYTSIHVNSPGEKLIPLNPKDIIISQKIDRMVEDGNLKYLHDRILPRSLFGIESDFVDKNRGAAVLLEDAGAIDPEKQVKLFTNDHAGKAGRARWFVVDRSVIPKGREYIGEWQVVVSSANAGGQKRDSQMALIDSQSAFGRSRVALASFKTEEEARNFFAYAQTWLVRYAFLLTDEALSSLGKQVPDILDYTGGCSFLDFKGDLNQQLYEKAGLTADEIKYVENTVMNMRRHPKSGRKE